MGNPSLAQYSRPLFVLLGEACAYARRVALNFILAMDEEFLAALQNTSGHRYYASVITYILPNNNRDDENGATLLLRELN